MFGRRRGQQHVPSSPGRPVVAKPGRPPRDVGPELADVFEAARALARFPWDKADYLPLGIVTSLREALDAYDRRSAATGEDA